MDKHRYENNNDMRWTVERVETRKKNAKMNPSDLLIESQSTQSKDELVITNLPCSSSYSTSNNYSNDDDKIDADNLIYVTRDSQVIDEMIGATSTNENDIIMVINDNNDNNNNDDNDDDNYDYDDHTTPMRYEEMLEQAGLISNHDDSNTNNCDDYRNSEFDNYIDNTPQMVTEEIITDDWVQCQGEERVEIPVEQIIGSSSQVFLDMELPLPTIQDEYSALRPYPCDFCSRRFRKKAYLMNHMVTHRNDRPHSYKLCNSSYVRRQDLINHLEAHAQEGSSFNDHDSSNFDGIEASSTSQKPSNNNNYECDWNSLTKPAVQSSIKNVAKSDIDLNVPTISNRICNNNVNTSRIHHINHPKLKENVIPYRPSDIDNNNDKEIEQLQITRGRVVQQRQSSLLERCKPFVCQKCGLAFAREKALISHEKNHQIEDSSSYECKKCKEIFWSRESLQEHTKTHGHFGQSNSEYDSSDGDYKNENKIQDANDRLKTHVELNKFKGIKVTDEENSINQHCCSICGEIFAEHLDLVAHSDIHDKYAALKCVLCGEKFFEENVIKNHLQIQHGNEMTENSCILCGKECRDRKALIKHAWEHSREKCHSCTKCGKTFNNKARLRRHWTSHRDKSVQCEVCHKAFPDGRTLSNHRHSHSTTLNGKLYPCFECGKTFGSRSSQQIHVRIHTGEKPYGCRYCWKAFADGGTLRKHERIHTGEKPYVCPVCPRAFNQRVVLREHIRSHHSGVDNKRGIYYCRVCSTEMLSSHDLIQHLVEHSDVNTAKKRQPVSGPRKYKRRRKLKPHELALIRMENKCVIENVSDIDVGVDDNPINIKESLTTAASKKNNKNIPSKQKRQRARKNFKTRGKKCKLENYEMSQDDEEKVEKNERRKNFYMNTRVANWDDAYKLNTSKECLNNSITTTMDSMRSVLHNLDDTVNTRDNTDGRERKENINNNSIEKNLFETDMKVNGMENCNENTKARGSKTKVSVEWNDMEKCKRSVLDKHNVKNENYIETIESNVPLLRKVSAIVDDYDIISPALEPPRQISCSPLHIKEEQGGHGQELVQSRQLYDGHATNDSLHNSRLFQTSNNELYDAHLLLEASGLRSDIDDILHSPLKIGKYHRRQRFVSESSSNTFIADHSEEEQNFIKIEPTSPDLREIINGVVYSTNSSNNITASNCTNETELETRTLENKSIRRSKQATKYPTNNVEHPVKNAMKCLTFPTMESNSGQLSTARCHNSLETATTSMSCKTLSPSSMSCLNYTYDPSDEALQAHTPRNVSNHNSDNSFSPLNTMTAVSIANSVNSIITQQQHQKNSQKNTNGYKNRLYYECEMCSMIFTDRAQLLDHVPIHI